MKTHRLSGKAYEDLDSTVVIVILLTQRYNNFSEIHHVWGVESLVFFAQCVHAINGLCGPHVKRALIWTGRNLVAKVWMDFEGS